MAEKKYNLRPTTKLRATPFSCYTCKDDEPKDNEDEVIGNDDINDIYPDLTVIQAEKDFITKTPKSKVSQDEITPETCDSLSAINVENSVSLKDKPVVSSARQNETEVIDRITSPCSSVIGDHTPDQSIFRPRQSEQLTASSDQRTELLKSTLQSKGPTTVGETLVNSITTVNPTRCHTDPPRSKTYTHNEQQMDQFRRNHMVLDTHINPQNSSNEMYQNLAPQVQDHVLPCTGGWGEAMNCHATCMPRMTNSHTGSEVFAPKVKLPTFSGKGDWESFWVQFDFFCSQYDWAPRDKMAHLMSSLRDSAMQYVARLPLGTRSSFDGIVTALQHRFGDHVLPETHRASLQTLKKNQKETLHEFAARVGELVSKSYPGLASSLHTSLTIEAIVNGLPDPSLVYDVLTKKPSTVNEALEMISWHECVKGTSRRKFSGIRQVVQSSHSDAGRDRKSEEKMITEERLNEFGKQLEQTLITSMKGIMKQSGSKQGKRGDCYLCHKAGHFYRECPQNRQGNSRMPKSRHGSSSVMPNNDSLN